MPGRISAGCGVGWMAEKQEQEKLEVFMREQGLAWQGIHDLMACSEGRREEKMEAGQTDSVRTADAPLNWGRRPLKRVLEKLPRMENENLLVGYSHGDDGAVYRLSEDLAVIHTLDFFPPVVEDPGSSGRLPPPMPSATYTPWEEM